MEKNMDNSMATGKLLGYMVVDQNSQHQNGHYGTNISLIDP